METRKLQQVGGGTYTVSVPKAWAVEHGLEAGAEVHIYSHADGSIVVRSAERDGRDLDAVTIEVEGTAPALVTRALQAAHAIGFRTVTLRPAEAFTHEQRRAARRTKRHLVGTEILVEAADEISLQTLLDASDVSVRQSVVQLQFVALSVLRGTTTAFPTAEGADLDRLRERADEADRLYRMVARHLGRAQTSMEEVDRLDVSRPDLFDYYATARELQRAGELAVSVGQATAWRSEPLAGDGAEEYGAAAEAVVSFVDDAATAVLEGFDVGRAHDVADRRAEVVDMVDALEATALDPAGPLAGAQPADVRALTRALDALLQAIDLGETIAEVALRAAMRNGQR